ncbi:MAG: hypothetical protein ACD_3C00050G0002 [uncultured bacterium (gcode 4)]|uniref:Uncharacterized protein n=1 Tax=uncultured bacterium (gcode 4) TaxID=1234023 RepID=K2G2M7_9BACT|nr:MAG: hypothetical protein ACD_3C00050G0002 [uncultured bacterium (gcode 4)]
MGNILLPLQNFFESHIVFVMSFLENLLFVLLIPTLCLIPALIILGSLWKVKKDYSRVRKYTKWWIFSLFPAVLVYLVWVAVKIYFYKWVWM